MSEFTASTDSRVRVVIADDNRVMTDVVRFNLEQAGYAVFVGRDGVEAWQLLESVRPAALVTDYQMPRMNGEELCRKARADDRFADLAIVMLTAKGMEYEYVRNQSALGIYKVLFKPFSPRELVATVQACLARKETTPIGVV